MMRRLFKILLSTAIIALIVLAVSEVIVRLVGYSTIYLYDPIYMPYKGDKDIPFVMKPGLRNVRAHGNITISTDNLGLRCRDAAGKPEVPDRPQLRIALVGSSVAFGYGVKTDDTFACRLEDTLNQKAGCRSKVYNFAISSYSLKEIAATLGQRVPDVRPQLVVASLAFGDFDLSRVPGVDEQGYNTHGNISKFLSNYPLLKSGLRQLHLSYIVRDALGAVRAHSEKKETGAGLPPSFDYLIRMKEEADRLGMSCLVLTLPSLGADGSQFGPTLRALREKAIPCLDVSALTLEFTPEQFKASRFDYYHPSAAVHARIADALSAVVLRDFVPKACKPGV